MVQALGGFFLACVLLFGLRHVLGLFWSATLFVVATCLFLQYGFDPPVPSSVFKMYVGTTILAVLLYVSSSEEGRQSFFAPIIAVLAEKRLWPVRWLMMILVPGLVAWQGYHASLPSEVPPPKVRSVHPSPPNTINFQGPGQEEPRTVDVVNEDSPIGPLKKKDPETYAAHVKNGKKVYYQNCYYCHGDQLIADGHYAGAVKPPPANFLDPGNLPMLQENFVFWRIAKGGPGLPDAGTPWDSSMPAWEKMLSEAEIWEVIAFMYEQTGYQPRTRETHGAPGAEGGH